MGAMRRILPEADSVSIDSLRFLYPAGRAADHPRNRLLGTPGVPTPILLRVTRRALPGAAQRTSALANAR